MGTTRQNGLWMQWMQNKFAYRYWPFARPALRLRLDSVTRPSKVLHMRLPHAWHVLATACRSPAGRPPCPTAQRLRAEISLPSAAAFVSQAHVAPDGPDAGTRTCGKRWACVATSGFNAKRFCNARHGKAKGLEAVRAVPNGPTAVSGRTPRHMATAGLQRPYRCAADRHSWSMNKKKARTAGCSL